tara:strand:+ start:127 stop:534 length:408 start_codon:yes stop_codon:yes gene_type:complete
MSWEDILKARPNPNRFGKKIKWKEFKRSIPKGTTLTGLNEYPPSEGGRSDRQEDILTDVKVIFPNEEGMMAWLIEHGEHFEVTWLEGGRSDFNVLSIPRKRFDEYEPKPKLKFHIESDPDEGDYSGYEFKDYKSP